MSVAIKRTDEMFGNFRRKEFGKGKYPQIKLHMNTMTGCFGDRGIDRIGRYEESR